MGYRRHGYSLSSILKASQAITPPCITYQYYLDLLPIAIWRTQANMKLRNVEN